MSDAAGHDPAFERLVAEHRRGVLRVCRSVLRDEHLGDDAAQETFLRLWRRRRAGRAPERVGPWLGRVAVHTALDQVRRRRIRADAEEPIGEEAGASPPPEERASEAELREHLERALERLPEGQRTVFALRHSGGCSLREAAELLGLALPTVKTQFARACLRLQSALRPHEDRR